MANESNYDSVRAMVKNLSIDASAGDMASLLEDTVK